MMVGQLMMLQDRQRLGFPASSPPPAPRDLVLGALVRQAQGAVHPAGGDVGTLQDRTLDADHGNKMLLDGHNPVGEPPPTLRPNLLEPARI